MPTSVSYPGVYIEEVPSGVRTITGVATSITAFVGYTARGLDHRATRVLSYADFERSFGGLDPESELSYAVRQFFDNGGTDAYVVRVPRFESVAASITALDASSGNEALTATALSNGVWANGVLIEVDYDDVSDSSSFNVTVTDPDTGEVETFSDVTMDSTASNYVVAVVNDEDSGSGLIEVEVPDASAGRPVETGTVGGDITLADIPNDGAGKSDNDYKLLVSSDLPASGAPTDVEVTFIATGESIPGSILGVCRLLERKINVALQAALPGAAVRCVPGSSGAGVRVVADFDSELIADAADAKITFADSGSNSALSFLKLDSVTANVAHYVLGSTNSSEAQQAETEGTDGSGLPKTADLIGSEADFTGIYALEKVDLFNLLCIPDATRARTGDPSTLDPNVSPNDVFNAAMNYCTKRRAFLLIDPPPEVDDDDSAADWKSSGLTVQDKNGAAYFPRLRIGDPLNDFKPRTFAPCGVMAGLYARTDATRGLWKTPAGTEATLKGVQGLVYKLTDAENGVLNPLGLNCIRSFPVYGTVSWGGRTLVGAEAQASEWKYLSVRRTALYLEESLYRGTQWVVFEPNDEPLWAQIRLNIGAFMHGLFRQGAFQGKTPKEAYLVKCDKETTTQDDINKGIVNILVGFAPLKPAEFVVIKIQQLAGDIQS